jgi:protein-disulfide reductase (glutathione)
MDQTKRLVFLIATCILSVCIQANLSGGGFGSHYAWISWSEAKTVARQQNKPIMVILHKSWCGACKRLKPLVAGSKAMLDLSDKFVMVNAEDDEDPSNDPSFSIDGGYIPRIIFLDPSGDIRPEFSNKKRSEKFKYFYPSSDEIIPTMEEILADLAHKEEL